MDEESFAFGSFHLIPAQRVLLEDGKPLRLGSRALDILIALVESAGEIIGKYQLIARTWPDAVVDEGALRVHVAALRKALGDGRDGMRYIANVPGRGYSFAAPVAREQRRPTIAPDQAPVGGSLPAPLTRILGRDGVIAGLTAQLSQRRFLTIVGPGGVGKTTVAIAVAQSVSASYKDGVWFVGLSSLADPDLVPSALTAVLGISQPAINPVSGLTGWLRDRHLLIVLDSCEHVIAAAARIVEEILRAARHVSILATSREPLRAEGEWVHRLASLRVPPDSAGLTTDDVLHYPAVELFTERAAAVVEELSFGSAELRAVVEICRSLDGMPLALELAAAQIDVFGIKGLAARLSDRFAVLTRGRRTALPRHQTLRATMDWSYDLLPPVEQLILSRLSVFQGDFTMAAAAAVAADDHIKITDVIEGVANLAMKSLVTTDISGELTYHRMLDTTRAYALEKLSESSEVERVRRLQAEYFRDLFERAETEWETRPATEWLGDYAPQIDNLRAALDWAFSPDGDASTGIALTTAAVPLWMHLSLMAECRSRVEQALAVLKVELDRDAPRGMKLYAALATSLIYTGGSSTELEAAWAKSLELAERLDNTEYRLRAVWELWTLNRVNRWHRAALTQAQRFCALAANQADPNHRLIGERMLGISHHYLGDQVSARRHLETVVDEHVKSENRSHIVRFQVDLRVSARTFLVPILWLLGFPDQAMRAAKVAVEEAEAVDHVLSVCHALVFGACPTVLLAGDLASGEHYVSMLIDHSDRHGLARWHAYGSGYRGALAIKRGDIAVGLQLLRAGLDELGGFATLRFMDFLMPEALCQAGEIVEGLATVEGAIARSLETEELRLVAELLRIKGELLLLQGGPRAPATAEGHFRQALDWARRQGALSWELRAATSLARLLSDQGRSADAIVLLEPVYDRFTEGFDTPDLKEAKALLEELTRARG
jgi:predicted ATPase/DNA-binding winged helix-turn-helix (wHTH) protein